MNETDNIALTGRISNPAWIESHEPEGRGFEHLTSLYALVNSSMKPVHPRVTGFSLSGMEMLISRKYSQKLEETVKRTKRLADRYLKRAGLPCIMELDSQTSPQSV